MKHRQPRQIQIFMHTDLPDGWYGMSQDSPDAGSAHPDGAPPGWRPSPLLPTPDSRPIQFTALGLMALLGLRGTSH